jgi:hypothetical protein
MKQTSSLRDSSSIFGKNQAVFVNNKTPTHFGGVCQLGMEADPSELQKVDRNSTVLKLSGVMLQKHIHMFIIPSLNRRHFVIGRRILRR